MSPARVADNPFTPHTPADRSVFVDREREIDLIFGHILASQRGNVAISGSLGSGKSSLLLHVSHPEVAARVGAEPPATTLLYVDVQSVTPFTFEAFWRRVARLIARVPGAAATALAPLATTPIVDLLAVEIALDDMDDHGGVLVLLLDEFEWAVHAASAEEATECRHFLAQTATLARRTPRNLALVVATERPLHEVTREIESWRGSPFATLFTSVVLKPLSDDHVRALLGRVGSASVAVDEADARLILDLSGGHPTVIQASAFALVHGRRRGLEGVALHDAIRAAVADLHLDQLTGSMAFASVAADSPAPTRPPAEAAGTPERPAVPVYYDPPTPGLSIDEQNGDVLVDGQRIDHLTALEFSLLKLLCGHPNRLCSKTDIIHALWGAEAALTIDDARVEKLVSRLRRKIEAAPGRPQYVRTVRGRGYRFVP
ncbi:MAG: winged helix-turn-helix domain-containing protein, partial [Ardenticatenales bacterium]